MRIHWRQPRFRLGYLTLLIFINTLILLRWTRRRDLDDPLLSNRKQEDYSRIIRSAGNELIKAVPVQRLKPAALGEKQQPTGRKEDLNRIIRSTGNELIKNVLAQQQQPAAYDGPFPDSRVLEGVQFEMVDYHNYTQAARDKERVGLGEHGEAASLPSDMQKEQDASYWANGFNGLLSDRIALDRAVPDIRHPTCSSYKYYKHLPTVSVVIPFFEEQLSALQRTVTSVVNRSPAHLLKEIILVDDGSSTREDLNAPLEQWLAKHASMARVVRMPERQGLITARLTGAGAAVGDVILVLDSHCEVMTNWLPPLLNPIAENYRTAVCPLIDVIAWDTFAYSIQDNGARGAFDWNFFYKRLPLSPEKTNLLPQPFPNPVMNGGLFAISRQFFWELGGYDPGLAIWGGEQYDLSFKIWQCGGRMFDAPCSRVGHVFRGHPTNWPQPKQTNYINTNYKRVAVVWMDEHIEALYKKNPEMRSVDAGDISGELAIRERLQCKSFKWYLENVAPDLLKMYPPFEPADFANGTIRNVFNNLCVDTGGRSTGDVVQSVCHGGNTQQFSWCWREFVRVPDEQFCLESGPGEGRSPILYNCDNIDAPSQQKWKYNPFTKQLQNGAQHLCLEAKNSSQTVLSPCAKDNSKQQWEFQHVNLGRIREVFPEIR